MSPEEVVRIIRKNVKFENEPDYKKWDGLPMDVRWILREAVKMIECQEEYIEKLMKDKGGINMDAVEFLKIKSRMCNSYTKMAYCGDCKNLGCPVAIKYGVCYVTNESDDVIAGIVETVKEWGEAHPVINLTDQQKTAIRGRIAEGAKWIYTDYVTKEHVYFSSLKPIKTDRNTFVFGNYVPEYFSVCNKEFYNFVTFENSPLYLPDLLEGEE